jgi:hypothetical protein
MYHLIYLLCSTDNFFLCLFVDFLYSHSQKKNRTKSHFQFFMLPPMNPALIGWTTGRLPASFLFQAWCKSTPETSLWVHKRYTEGPIGTGLFCALKKPLLG